MSKAKGYQGKHASSPHDEQTSIDSPKADTSAPAAHKHSAAADEVELKANGKPKRHPFRKHKAVKIIGIVVAALLTLYCVTAFTECPGLSYLRNLWIGTAMTTGTHKWLAYIFPPWVVDSVMADQQKGITYTSDPNLVPAEPDTSTQTPAAKPVDHTAQLFQDILGGDPSASTDVNGNKVLESDYSQGIIIVQIQTATYTGRMMFIDDPARVHIQTIKSKGSIGEHLSDLVSDADALGGINANGLYNPGFEGNGGQITGWTAYDGGQIWGSQKPGRDSGGFNTDNQFIVGNITDPKKLKIRDMSEWGPAMIVNGKIMFDSTGGYGLQPRSAIGQLEDGSVVLCTVDGRQPGHSIGITVQDLAKVFKSYNVVNALLNDGGSSAIMNYQGSTIGTPADTNTVTGRRLPNAWVVTKK
jgi:exopolysaccharide biosynthesis protein